MVSAISETELIHFANHLESTRFAFGLTLRQEAEMGDFGGNEQHGRRIWASRHAGTASDAGGGLHGEIRYVFRYRQSIRFRRGPGSDHDVAAGFNDLIKGAAVDHEVFNWLERCRASNPDLADPANR